MIRSERELQAAEAWIEYWKSTLSAAQSWIGNEQAGQKIVGLRNQIVEYRRLLRGEIPAPVQTEETVEPAAGP